MHIEPRTLVDVAMFNTAFRSAHAQSGNVTVHTRFVFGLSNGRTTDTKLEDLVDRWNRRKLGS